MVAKAKAPVVAKASTKAKELIMVGMVAVGNHGNDGKLALLTLRTNMMSCIYNICSQI